MPIPFIFHIIENGPPPWLRDNFWLILKSITSVVFLGLLKVYTSGARCLVEKDMHGKVVIITGGTTGIGAQTTLELAARGAQMVLLTRQPPSDPFLADYIEDVRRQTGNQMVYAEQVNLLSPHSIRKFATRWIDNAPPRRLDLVILCASELTPPGKGLVETKEGVEATWMVNFLANFHLLGILSPAIRAQPFDRDVRIIFTTCSSYIGSPPLETVLDGKKWSAGKAYARSKLALMVFGQSFQKHLDAFKRPDSLPMNARVVFVDPGYSRTPSMRQWLTRGSLWGLALYLLGYLFPWFLLKSPNRGAQSILYASMEPSLGRGPGGKMVKECMEVDFARKDINDDAVGKKLWEDSDKLIEKIEKEQAIQRAKDKKVAEKEAQEQKEAEQAAEIESLVDTIKKGRQKETENQQSSSIKARKKSKKAT